MKLTAQAVARLRHEGSLPFRDIKDDGTRGLYLRILKSGGRRWIVRYKIGGRTRVATIGDASEMTLAAARAQALAWASLIKDGRDPATEVQRKAAAEKRLPTVAAFAAEYLERHAKPNKRSWRTDERLLQHDVLPVIGGLRIDTVKRRDIVSVLDAIRDRDAPVLANRVLAVTRRMFAFAIERGVIEHTPFAGVRASRETARARTLTDDEIRHLWAATGPGSPRIEAPTRMALRLLLLTGARVSEVCSATWDEIDTGAAEWVVPAARTKNGREHRMPLSNAALDVMREAEVLRASGSPWLLPSVRGTGHVTLWGVLDAVQRILGEDVTAHDLRRTVATGLQQVGARLEVTEAVLNHVSGSRGGIVGVYQRHDWRQEKRAALDAWTRRILAIAAGDTADTNVVQLTRVA
jgi:integrase